MGKGKGEKYQKELVLISVSILFLMFLLFWNTMNGIRQKQEKARYTSASQVFCGVYFHYYSEKKGRNVYHFFVLKKSSGEEKKFSSNASYAKQHYSPYWAKNKEVLQKVKVGDQICVTYSLKYAETSLKGEYDPLPNYLIKIEFQR